MDADVNRFPAGILLVSPDIELHEEDPCELSKFSQSSSHAVTDDGNESDLVSKSEL